MRDSCCSVLSSVIYHINDSYLHKDGIWLYDHFFRQTHSGFPMNIATVSSTFQEMLGSSAFKLLLWIEMSVCVFGFAPVWAFTLQDSSSDRKPQIAIAKQEIDSGDFVRAESLLNQIIQTNSHSSADVYRLLGYAQFKGGNIYQALTTCERGLAIYPDSNPLAEVYITIVRSALSAEDRRVRLEESVKKAPDSPVLVKALGEELLALNPNDARALQLLSSAAKLSPRDAEAHFFYGESACFNQEDALCIKELQRAHELAPKNEQANMQLYTMIAVAEDKRGLIRQAAEDFNRAMRANRTLAHPSSYAAMKYVTYLSEQNRRDRANAIIDEILRWDSSYGPAHFQRATFLSEQGKKEDAIAEAELALQDARGTEAELRGYHAFLARTYFALARQKEALIHQSWIESHQPH